MHYFDKRDWYSKQNCWKFGVLLFISLPQIGGKIPGKFGQICSEEDCSETTTTRCQPQPSDLIINAFVSSKLDFILHSKWHVWNVSRAYKGVSKGARMGCDRCPRFPVNIWVSLVLNPKMKSCIRPCQVFNALKYGADFIWCFILFSKKTLSVKEKFVVLWSVFSTLSNQRNRTESNRKVTTTNWPPTESHSATANSAFAVYLLFSNVKLQTTLNSI